MLEKLKERKRILIDYYIIAIALFAFMFYMQTYDSSLNTTIMTILAIYLIIFPIVILYTYRYALHIFLFVFAFITGFYSYYVYSIGDHSLLNALYFTFKLYLLDMTEAFSADGSYLFEYPILVEIARWSAAAYTISTLFIAMYRFLEMSILLFFAQTFGKHYIIFGWNDNSRLLVEDLRKHKKRVIVLDDNLTTDDIDELESMKVVAINDTQDKDTFTKCSLKKAHSIILLHNRDIDNVFRYIDIQQYFEKSNTRPINDLIIQIEHERYKEQILSITKTYVGETPDNVQVVNIYDELAKSIWQEHADLLNRDQASIHFLIVGFQSIGQQITNELTEHYDGKQLHITALDEDIDARAKQYTDNLSHMPQRSQSQYTFIPFDAETDNLEQFIENDQQDFDFIFICLEENYLDLIEGINLSERFPDVPIFIHLEHNVRVMNHLLSFHTGPLYTMESLQDILTLEHFSHKKSL